MHARWVASIVIAVAFCETSATQTPDKVDFARDVQPIFRQHCVGCHGAEIHQAGLRLDRRSDAMRGGTLTPGVIHPGDGRSSFLYMKISSPQFGPQMPFSPFHHIALNVDAEAQKGIEARLKAAGYKEPEHFVLEHGYCRSVYATDPTGMIRDSASVRLT